MLERWRGGDEHAGRELFANLAPALMRFFRNRVRGDQVQDLVQETMLRLVDGRDRIDKTVFGYAYGIAWNLWREHLTKAQRLVVDPLTHTLEDMGMGMSTMVGRGERQQLLNEALRRLPLQLQAALELYYFESLTSAQIAECFDTKPATMRRRLSRAREQLERIMLELEA
nr:sigma-70 family RNA polymerase sigma factor [Pseudenhygromyxa sp. WMMC2535]